MQQQTFNKLMTLAKTWLNEANTLSDKYILSEKENTRAKTLVDCAEALNNTLMEITDSEKELILTNH